MYTAQMFVFSSSVGICLRKGLFRATSVSVAGTVERNILSGEWEASEGIEGMQHTRLHKIQSCEF